jgi:hypothetical protein
VQAGLTRVDAAVDVYLRYIDESVGLLDRRHPEQQAHGDLCRLAMFARKERSIDGVQPDCRTVAAPGLRRSRLPILGWCVVEELEARSCHSGVPVLTEVCEHLPLNSQNRDRLVKDSLSDKSSEGEDLLALTYDDRRWCMAVLDKL